MSNGLGGKAAIVGIGATEFSKESGRSEMSLASESVLAAILDAGLQPSDIDGMVTYSTDNNPDVSQSNSRNEIPANAHTLTWSIKINH